MSTNAINVPIAYSPRFQQDTVMAIARIKASLGPGGSPTFTTLSLPASVTGIVKATAGVLAGGGTHADLGGVTANQHHNQAHALDGADHTVSGLTAGHVLQALTPTTFGFAAAPGSADSLLLDQTTPQTVSNGAPKFADGIVIKAGQKLYFDGE